MAGCDGRVRCKDAGSLDMRHIGAIEDDAARRPARPGGTRLHSGTSSPMPSKLSLAEQPPCKRKAVGSIPTWGSSSPRSPTWQRHPAQTRTSRGSNPRGGTHDATSFKWQDARLLPGQRWFDPSRRSSFLGRLTAGSSALNRRMRGSNPARGARSYGRGHGVHAVSNTAGEGSIPSVRAPHAPVV